MRKFASLWLLAGGILFYVKESGAQRGRVMIQNRRRGRLNLDITLLLDIPYPSSNWNEWGINVVGHVANVE